MVKKKNNKLEYTVGEDMVYDMYLSKTRSAKLAWIVAIVAILLTFFSILAVMLLTPLKENTPYVFRVDNATGKIEHVSRLKDEPITSNEAISKYFVGDYVRTREGYMFETAEEDFKKVNYLSSPKLSEEWRKYFNPQQNRSSPVRVYADKFDVTATIRSISFLEDGTARVRFDKKVKSRIDGSTKNESAIATVVFIYNKTDVSDSYRLINPLGFQVRQYRVDADNLSEK